MTSTAPAAPATPPVRRRALVTGGSRGIGAAVAAALAAADHAVAVHCRADTAAAEAVVAALPGTGHAVVRGDIADPEQAQALVGAAVTALGGVDVLVNNAGVYFEQPITTTSYVGWQDAWRRIIGINLFGAANVTWCVTDHLLRRPEGPAGARIITVGSRGAYRGEPDAPAYGASKAAVHSLTQSLAVALAPHGIVAAAVAPGFVRTDMTEALLSGSAGDAIRAQSPFGRVAEADEIAAAVAWLAAPGARWASGAVLDLNGASHLR
ncbi:MAG TPA: SDR family oxidoreductase [Streptosporangiaceae bacterium]|nr:SDR family oxidoreductase [Streptosporangiaceae bacterium]